MTTVASTLLAVSLVVAGPSGDEPRPPAVRASEAIEARDYAEAARLFAKAYADDGARGHLYRQGMALALAGELRAAILAFERFIATGPPNADVEQAREKIRDLEPTLATQLADAGELRTAAGIYAKRFARDGAADDLLTQGELLHRADACGDATAAFERYLDLAPNGPGADSARARIDACRPKTGRVAPTTRSRVRPLTVGLWSAGALLTGAGVGVLVAAPFVARQASAAQNENLWATRARRANALAISGTIITGVGASVLIAALIHTIIKRRGRAQDRSARR